MPGNTWSTVKDKLSIYQKWTFSHITPPFSLTIFKLIYIIQNHIYQLKFQLTSYRFIVKFNTKNPENQENADLKMMPCQDPLILLSLVPKRSASSPCYMNALISWILMRFLFWHHKYLWLGIVPLISEIIL